MTNQLTRRCLVSGLTAFVIVPGVARSVPLLGPAVRATKLITAARQQIGITTIYDPAYTQLTFPGGDVARSKGVCTDVVICAYRDAFGDDLQSLVNADMKRAFGAYPPRWGLRSTDRNIDHRRVPNLQTFMTRAGAALPVGGWQAGDIFTCLVGGSLPHIGIVSDQLSARGHPMVIHNIGSGTREEDALLDHRLTGRFRWRI